MGSMMSERWLIDPPGGSKFGFPKILEGDVRAIVLNDWLLEQGYPVEIVEAFPDGVPCRIRKWDGEVEQIKRVA